MQVLSYKRKTAQAQNQFIHINRVIRNLSSLEPRKKKSNTFLSRGGLLLHTLSEKAINVVGFLLFPPSFGAVN